MIGDGFHLDFPLQSQNAVGHRDPETAGCEFAALDDFGWNHIREHEIAPDNFARDGVVEILPFPTGQDLKPCRSLPNPLSKMRPSTQQ